jgi:hypothetical protein
MKKLSTARGMKGIAIISTAVMALIVASTSLSVVAAVVPIVHPGLSNERDQDRSGETQVKQYQGDLLRVEGTHWVLKDTTDREVRLEVDEKTRISGRVPAIGDRMEAYISPTGHAESIRNLPNSSPRKNKPEQGQPLDCGLNPCKAR